MKLKYRICYVYSFGKSFDQLPNTLLLGFNNQSNYNSQGGVGGGGNDNDNNQGFGTNHSQYHNPVGYGREDGSMSYQYR